ncbi:MAG TPA: acyl-CoA dehydratase activase [Polyangia bacterium]|jgi:predicted CoA-substrate-specific enzyme activase
MKRLALGIDIGSLFVKVALVEVEGENGTSRPSVVSRFYRAHHGNPQAALRAALEQVGPGLEVPAAIVGTGAGLVEGAAGMRRVDLAAASVRAVRASFPEARNIIDVGGGSVSMITVDHTGKFQGYSENSLCAAGTGSFLDEQAARMEIEYDDLKRFGSVTDPPNIATRCAVFAKSDLIHRQQEGYTKEQMWSGLCRGLTSTMLQTLLKGKPLTGLTVLIGGVAQNGEVLRWLKQLANARVETFADAHLAAAIGAAMVAQGEGHDLVSVAALLDAAQPRPQDSVALSGPRRERLELVKTRYPSFDVAEAYCHRPETGAHIAAASAPTLDDTEVRISAWEEGQAVRVYLGIDIGSTSTKAVLVDQNGAVVADLYRKTLGDPVAATKKLFVALTDLAAHRHAELTILGCGTTGSGRKLVGEVVGADGIINEISAHVAGAMSVDPTIDTIFEIGGQDSKYMRTSGGRIADAAMNYVCAAGTGSFVEEQAKKLGFPLDAVGEVVMGLAPPATSDRCTVFMEQDVHHLIRKGFSPAEAMAGVLYSVIQNYLTKVVANRPVSREKVFFQGATARNRGLVAAIEKHLDVEVVVSPYCHVMGAYGVALLVRDLVAEKPSRFRGLDLASREVRLRKETCDLCDNYCTITSAEVEGQGGAASFGYMCGRDPAEKKQKLSPGFEMFRLRERLMREAGKGPKPAEDAPVVGLPRTLSSYTFLPLWRRFFAELGFKTVTSKETSDETKQKSSDVCGAEFCFPAKLAHGHVAELVQREGVDFVLVPSMISVERNEHSSNSHFCPYLQSLPSYIRSALELNGIPATRLLTPVVDFRQGEWRQVDCLFEALGGALGRSRRQLRDAWRLAQGAQQEFARRCAEEGERRLAALKAEGKRAIVALGRPYNTFDMGANLGLPQKIADLGHTVVPIDFLAFRPEELGPQYRNLYWHYGQRIVAAARRIAKDESLSAIYFTNFNCGPDSFLLTYTQHLMGAKPMLVLELDEHGGDAGYLTRVEAFLDVLRSRAVRSITPPHRTEQVVDFHHRTLWIPPMHVVGTPIFAATMQAYGYDARALPTESREAFELGRKLTRGTECLPTAATIGGFVARMRELDLDPARQALFMPTAEGPCRFGQYATLHRMILDHEGYHETAILSPASYNSYQGLEEPLRRGLWKALLLGDILYKAVCKVRPYERELGATDRLARQAIARVCQALRHKADTRPLLRELVAEFAALPQDRREKKPLVGVVGEIYVRCSVFSNEDVVRAIEHAGGEAWLAPMSEWILYTSHTEKKQAFRGVSHLPNPVAIGLSLLKNHFLGGQEHEYYDLAGELLADRREPPMAEVIGEGRRFIPEAFEGEAIITIGRAVLFARRGAAMVVNCAPFGCMPGTITTGIFQQVQEQEHVPMVNMFYDGGGHLNSRIGIFLANLVAKRGKPAPVRLPVLQPARPERRPAVEAPRIDGV